MAARQYFAHNSPDGKTPWYWLQRVGYRFSAAGENLAVNFFESSDVASAWMNSPSHRANIVKKGYKEIGIGVANGIYEGRNTVFVVQFFGTPLAMPVAVATTPTITPPPVAPAIVTTTPLTTPAVTQVLGEQAPPVVVATENIDMTSDVSLYMAKVLTSPRQYTNYFYAGIGLLVLASMLLVLFIESKVRHPIILARGFALIAVIIVLFVVNYRSFDLKTDVTATDLTANAIEVVIY